MARRKGISNKSKSITSARRLQHQQENKAPQSKALLGNEERVPIKEESPTVIAHPDNRMAPTQVPPSSPAPAAMTCADNNNTADLQNKYLHKKFKRASAAPAIQEPVLITSAGSDQNSNRESSTFDVSASPIGQSGRHVCPYCKLACAKPSVLQKHIRAHTNERPYPCEPCGFAFKTKSNLYKHRRSRAHYQRSRCGSGTAEEDASDADLSSSNASEGAPETPPPSTIVPTVTVPISAIISTTAITAKTPIYKPKFHKAALYRDDSEHAETTIVNSVNSTNSFMSMNSVNSTNAVNSMNMVTGIQFATSASNQSTSEADSLTRRISKIISQNEAIVDVVEPPLLQRKYGKINNMTNNTAPVVSKLANALLRNDQQPLNLTKPASTANEPHRERMRQRRYSETQPNALRLDQHPQNPEGSIIKDLLLKARARGDAPFMLGDIPEDLGIGGGSQYTCPLCRISFRGADNLETHRQYYCKGEINPAVGFQRSRSVNVQLPEYYNPNTLAKLASSTLKAPANNRRGHKPGDLKIVPPDFEGNKVSTPLPSPGPLLGSTRLVANDGVPPPKRSRADIMVVPPTLRSLEDLCSSPLLRSQQQLGTAASSLQMFGGEVRIVDDASGETKTLRIEPSSAQNSPASIIFTPTSSGPETPGRIVVRSGLHSGGTMLHNPPSTVHIAPLTPLTPSKKQQGPITPHQPNVSAPDVAPNITHFRFPPIQIPQECSSGPQTIVHGGRLIPFVPGIPGPNTLSTNEYNATGVRASPATSPRLPKTSSPQLSVSLANSFSKLSTASINTINSSNATPSNVINLSIPIINTDQLKLENNYYNTLLNNHSVNQNGFSNIANCYESKSLEMVVSSNTQVELNKEMSSTDKSKVNGDCSINYHQVNDNEKKRLNNKNVNATVDVTIPVSEERHFNFENLISKSEILNKPVLDTASNRSYIEEKIIAKSFNITSSTNLCTNVQSNSRTMETLYFRKNMHSSGNSAEIGKSKFLRPSSLPLKPGTFTPKKHHGITPNAHTLPLISPETPRPAKAFGQLYLNGHAYTYLGLKCSTKAYYCTLNRLQPMYVANQHTLSMYSNWRVCSEACPNPLKMTPVEVMALYDSRHRPQRVSIAKPRTVDDVLTHSSYWLDKNAVKSQGMNNSDVFKTSELNDSEEIDQKQSELNLSEGFESHEEYTYVRGRGRGKYVCSKCGIRCKKPSMLKKHARTHTDVRPFTCRHCAFSFKTKGNLTKHMKSKAHYKKCVELGIKPIPTSVEEDDCVDPAGGFCESVGVSGDSDSETDTDADEGNEGETESSDTDESKSRLPEHEAAHCLLSLSSGHIITEKQTSHITPGLISSNRPCTYPYELQKLELIEASEKIILEKNVNNISKNLHQSSKDQLPIITIKDNSEKLVSKDKTHVRSNNERIDDNSVVMVTVASSMPFKYAKTINSIRQNSVIISNHQSVNNVYYDQQLTPDGFQPIDLTKPRDKMQIDFTTKSSLRNTNIISNETDNEPMKVITNLVTSASKSYKPNITKVSDEIMFHAYLTEKALQETKIKQSQYTNNRFQVSGTTFNAEDLHNKKMSRFAETVDNASEASRLAPASCSAATTSVVLTRESLVGCRKPSGISESQLLSISNVEKSGIDTLAEIAACSSKLETNIDNNTSNQSDTTNSVKSATDNAKIVASEYLKITSEKSKNNELFEEKNDIGTSKLEILTKSNNDNILDTTQNDILDSNEQIDQKQMSEHMPARKVVVGAGGLSFKLAGSPNEFPSPGSQFQAGRVTEDGRSVCFICSKTFSKPSQLRLHINIHYFERPFRCEACAVSFRTKGHLQKHERSVSHHNKVSMASTFGAPTTSNPRPFNCSDCKIAFRIHGHLAKHLRSKMHVMRLECLGKLPFGTYAEIERAGVSLTDIDTTDCDNSLASLQVLAQKLHEKDPNKQGTWNPAIMAPPILPAGGDSDSEGEPMSPQNSSEEFLKNSLKTVDNFNSCSICKGSFETIKELEVHVYTEHNSQGIETSLMNVSSSFNSDIKRKCDEIDLYGKVIDSKRCKVSDS